MVEKYQTGNNLSVKGLTGQIEYEYISDKKAVLYIKLLMNAKLFKE